MCLHKNRPAGEAFRIVDPKDIEMKKLMKQMQGMGMGGEMFNREQLKERMEGMEAQVRDLVCRNMIYVTQYTKGHLSP